MRIALLSVIFSMTCVPPNPPSKKKRAAWVHSERVSRFFCLAAAKNFLALFYLANKSFSSLWQSSRRFIAPLFPFPPLFARARTVRTREDTRTERERERISDWILEKPSSEDLTTINNEHSYLFLERRRRNKRNAYTV
jgi:hypothetical protein